MHQPIMFDCWDWKAGRSTPGCRDLIHYDKDSKHPAYVDIAKKTKRELQKAKLSFERNLAEKIKGDTKSFLHTSGEKLRLAYEQDP